jgi:hypothetical protein
MMPQKSMAKSTIQPLRALSLSESVLSDGAAGDEEVSGNDSCDGNLPDDNMHFSLIQ